MSTEADSLATLSAAEMAALAGSTDHDLVGEGLLDVLAENRASARRWARMVEFHRRRNADYQARTASSPHFTLTPRQEVVVEIGELWGMGDGRARHQLNVALFLSVSLPQVWNWSLAGRIDAYRATRIADAARQELADPIAFPAFERSVLRFLGKHLTPVPGTESAVVTCTTKQLTNKLHYEITKLRSADAEERYRKARASRQARAHEFEDGMGMVSVDATIDDVRLADKRLGEAARQLRADGDPRTVEQLRADLAMDLLIGRGGDVPVPAFARPVVNLTVPLQTVIGVADAPGVLSGGTVVPASLARRIAQQPGATWYRMLTDPAGQMAELSTESYRPTPAIWRQVVAEQSSCHRSGCDKPAVECELDHRLRWPEGPTSASNLWPACKLDHKAKHAEGFQIEQADDGSFALRTPAGFRHPAAIVEQPVSWEWRELGWPEGDLQLSASELLDALAEVRLAREIEQAEDRTLVWELDLPESDEEDLHRPLFAQTWLARVLQDAGVRDGLARGSRSLAQA